MLNLRDNQPRPQDIADAIDHWKKPPEMSEPERVSHRGIAASTVLGAIGGSCGVVAAPAAVGAIAAIGVVAKVFTDSSERKESMKIKGDIVKHQMTLNAEVAKLEISANKELQIHKSTKETDLEMSKCQSSADLEKYRMSLSHELKMYKEQKDSGLECPLDCGALFKEKAHLQQHVKDHAKRDQPTHSCPFPGCGSHFFEEQAFMMHLKSCRQTSMPKKQETDG